MIDLDGIGERFASLSPHLNERDRRLFAATEARAAGFGGIAAVARVTGIAPSTIGRGLDDLTRGARLEAGRQRHPGAGRKPLTASDRDLLADLMALVEPDARGDLMSPLRWTCKSLRRLAEELRRLAEELRRLGHRISHTVVGELLEREAFSLQANSKTKERADHPDRDAQFAFLNAAVKAALAEGQPVISVDTKKKELVGDFKNSATSRTRRLQEQRAGVAAQGRTRGGPRARLSHRGAGPRGALRALRSRRQHGLGQRRHDNDTSAFAVATIRRWWHEVGHARYPKAARLVITADGGGSNSSRGRLWKVELQRFADELGIAIEVHHLPPGTSKWNKIEHKLFAFISMNWRAKPLVSYCVIVDLIAATTTKTGLTVQCELDDAKYPKGIAISDRDIQRISIHRATFHGDWNYTIKPSRHQDSAVIS